MDQNFNGNLGNFVAEMYTEDAPQMGDWITYLGHFYSILFVRKSFDFDEMLMEYYVTIEEQD
jgi:hypothetical protein